MFKIYFLLTLFTISNIGFAQNKRKQFFDNIAITLSLASDQFEVDKNRWPAVWKNNSRPVSYDLDSLKYQEFDRLALRLPKLDMGLRMQFTKDLFSNNPHRLLNRKVTVTSGIGYSHLNYRHKSLHGGDGFNFMDTSKIYINKLLQFTQYKSVLDFSQSFQYRYNSFLFRGIEYFLGIGYVVKVELSNKVNENYSMDKNFYNSNLQRFQKEAVLNSMQTLAGKTATTFQLFVPFGITKKLSGKSKLLFELDYTYSNNPYSDVNKKNEATAFHIGYIYTFKP
ncbi:MAG: hypothetical protein ABIQ56_00825 [Chitinophagaceae bacterium]